MRFSASYQKEYDFIWPTLKKDPAVLDRFRPDAFDNCEKVDMIQPFPNQVQKENFLRSNILKLMVRSTKYSREELYDMMAAIRDTESVLKRGLPDLTAGPPIIHRERSCRCDEDHSLTKLCPTEEFVPKLKYGTEDGLKMFKNTFRMQGWINELIPISYPMDTLNQKPRPPLFIFGHYFGEEFKSVFSMNEVASMVELHGIYQVLMKCAPNTSQQDNLNMIKSIFAHKAGKLNTWGPAAAYDIQAQRILLPLVEMDAMKRVAEAHLGPLDIMQLQPNHHPANW